jgi:superfamily II DNA/RNA helicase
VAKAGIVAEALHGNKSQNARQRALSRFASGEATVLVATDIAARGIDVEQVSHVINYELPDEAETYVHRIGRTARAGSGGVAVSFCDAEDRGTLRAIEKLTGKPLIVTGAPESAENACEPQLLKKEPARRQNRHSANRPPVKTAESSRARKAPKASARRKSLVPSGTVKWFNAAKGFGFVEPDDGGKDVFLHISAFEGSGIGAPREGRRLSFDLERDQRGRLSATNLRAGD